MTLDNNLLLSLVGIILTLIFGIYSIYQAISKGKKQKLYYFIDYIDLLFQDAVKSNPDLKISYKNEPITDNLIQFQGKIINGTGIDIIDSYVYKDLSICCSKYFSIRNVEIIKSSKDFNPNIKINNNCCSFSWEIFKKNEYFSFDMLVEIVEIEERHLNSRYDIINEFKKSVEVSHRIKDVDQVASPETINGIDSIWSQIFFSMVLLLVGIGLGLSGYSKGFKDRYIEQYKINVDSALNYYFVELKNDKIILTDTNKMSFEYQISDSQDLQFVGESKKVLLQREKVTGSIYILFGLLLFYAVYRYNLYGYKERKYIKEINNILKEAKE